MNNGALIFAHNNRDIDYALLALISAGLCKKYLKIPVSLVTDRSTLDWTKESKIYDKIKDVFDKIIEVEKPKVDNFRKLEDGQESKITQFANANRHDAWNLTPYDRTLLLDSDYLIFSDRLNEYWNVDNDIMISSAMNDVYDKRRIGYHDRYISDTGVHMYWATTVLFTKNEKTRSFFDLVNYVRLNYKHYGDLFRFNPTQYRNDISFSVAKHILDGFETNLGPSLPPVLTTQGRDILHSVEKDKLTFLINTGLNGEYSAASFKGIDLHIMNKQSIVRNKDSLLELI